MGQWEKRSHRLRLIMSVGIAALICWAAYMTWSVVRLNKKTGHSAGQRAIVDEELNDRDLARGSEFQLGRSPSRPTRIECMKGVEFRFRPGRSRCSSMAPRSLITISPQSPTRISWPIFVASASIAVA